MRSKRIAVIGGGPKAVALATKADVIAQCGGPKIEVKVFDPDGIGAAWDGSTGCTDGKQFLCTLAERDLGYPYRDDALAKKMRRKVAEAMRQQFSWQAFLVSRSKQHLANWTDGGRRPPEHQEFARYLRWAFGKTSNATQQTKAYVDEVVEDAASGTWTLRSVGADIDAGFDGVVLTGAGPVRMAPGPSSARVFDGQSFWLTPKQDQIKQLLAQREKPKTNADQEPIVVLGSGGTAATILAWLIENGARDVRIRVLSNSQAALHLRSENPFENRLFTNADAWSAMSPKARRSFSDRLNRGVVWESVLNRILRATKLEFAEGKVDSYGVLPDDTLDVQYTCFDHIDMSKTDLPEVRTAKSQPAGILIDASGFKALAWTKMFAFLPSLSKEEDELAFRKDLEIRMGQHLELTGVHWDDKPLVHVPGLSTMIGPGFASLMALGDMADRVLSCYGA